MEKNSLCISFIDNGETRGGFTYSLADSLLKLRTKINIEHVLRWTSSSIVMNRFNILTDFLDKTDSDWLLCVDSDIIFSSQQLEKLWNLRSDERQVLMGVYFLLSKPSKTLPQIIPSIYNVTGEEGDGQASSVHPLPINQIIKVDRAGFGFLLISRDVIKKVLGPDRINPFVSRQISNSTIVGEDFAFFENLEKHKINSYCHTGIVVLHEKNIGISRSYYDLYWNQVECGNIQL